MPSCVSSLVPPSRRGVRGFFSKNIIYQARVKFNREVCGQKRLAARSAQFAVDSARAGA
jgi:hypothetical protein